MKKPTTNRVSRLDLEQMRLITKAARLHHIKGKRQSEIAEDMGISQASVSRLLGLAQEHGIIRTVVVAPEGLHPDLEDGLVERFGLSAAHVIDMGSTDENVAHVLGAAAAHCLAAEFRGGAVMGFTSWSATLREMARNLEPRGVSGVHTIVEMLGDLGSPALQHEAALATSQMAKALNAEPVFLRTPGVMANADLRRAAVADVHIQAALKLLDALDVAFIGIGPADFHGPLKEGDNFFSAKQLAEVRAAGAVGQLHQRFIDAQGQPIETGLDDLVVGITLDQVRRARRRIAVAGGKAKHQAIAAALRGRWIDVLVTDVNTANFLISLAQKGSA